MTPGLYNIESRRSVLYDVAVNGDDDIDGNTIRIYRYQLVFNPSNPVQSALNLIESSSRTLPDRPLYGGRWLPGWYRFCHGRMTVLWTERDDDEEPAMESPSIFVSVSSPVLSISNNQIPPPAGSATADIQIVPLLLHSVPSSPLVSDFVPEFCITSGKLIIFWMSDGHGHSMTMHELL